MKIISEELVKVLKIRKRPSKVILSCAKLKVGQGLLVTKSEYKKKSPIFQLIGTSQNQDGGYLKNLKIRISTNATDLGWLLVRMK